MTQLFANNCPIRQHTAEGVNVGRCWHYCHDDKCPLHGDVHAALEDYRATGKLTDDAALDARPRKNP